MLRRLPRDLGSLFAAIETLDQASLIAKRKITIPFVKEALLLT
jgi:DnaA family protein